MRNSGFGPLAPARFGPVLSSRFGPFREIFSFLSDTPSITTYVMASKSYNSRSSFGPFLRVLFGPFAIVLHSVVLDLSACVLGPWEILKQAAVYVTKLV